MVDRGDGGSSRTRESSGVRTKTLNTHEFSYRNRYFRWVELGTSPRTTVQTYSYEAAFLAQEPFHRHQTDENQQQSPVVPECNRLNSSQRGLRLLQPFQ